jgi:AcrR family transcriptional regulator
MDTRERILAAALNAYAQYGFRGATTRRIAAIAGVNEVTLFRNFGSKQTLLSEALRSPAGRTPIEPLPADTADPAAALTAWTEACLRSLRARGRVLRASIGESAERPELGQPAMTIQKSLFAEVADYFERMRIAGLVRSSVDLRSVAAMLTATILADATGRDGLRDDLPPEKQAAAAYVGVILTALGASTRRAIETLPVRAPAPPSMPDATGA